MIGSALVRTGVLGVRLPQGLLLAGGAVAAGGAFLVVAAGLLPPALAGLAVVGVALVALTAWRPAIGCAALVLAVPLTAGLGRGTVLPLFRTSEAATILVALGMLLHFLPRGGQRRAYTAIDVAVGTFAAGIIVIPRLVLLGNHAGVDLDTWRSVLAPAQYLALYLMFSRAQLAGASLRLIVNLSMAASLLVAVAAVAQVVDVPGVRDFIVTYFPPSQGYSPSGLIYRPSSLLQHYSSVGAFAVLNYALALALATARHPGFSGPWLGTVMAVNALGVLASQTYAPAVGLLLATAAILWLGRRVPRQLTLTAGAILVGLLLFWPQIHARVEEQLGGGRSQSLETPENLQTRLRYWDLYFLPGLKDHVWFGTGTRIPSGVPERLSGYVDSEYLGLAFRAGVVGEILLLIMLVTIAVAGWRCRGSPDPWRRAMGATAVAYALVLAVMGITAEYLTFAGVSQQFWMMIGLLGAVAVARPRRLQAPLVMIGARAPWRVPRSPLRGRLPRGPWFRLEERLMRASALLFAGNATARLLSLVFSIIAARLLQPAGYGLMAYALVIAAIGSTLISNAPMGMARVLARRREEPRAQNTYFTNWVVVVAITTAVSAVLMVPIAMAAGLGGWLLVGVLANLLGIAVLQCYREAQRGMERYAAMVGIYVLANLAQLVAILAVTMAGYRAPALFVAIYGLSSVVALLPMQLAAPIALRFVRQALTWPRILAIARFIRPLLLQTAFFAVWLGADLVLVQRFMSPAAVGNYAAAKTLVNVLSMAPAAVGSALLPRIALLPEQAVGRYLVGVLGLTAAVTLPVVVVFATFGTQLVGVVFGSKYPLAAQPLALLAIGMALYGFYLILESTWIALGRPWIDALATGIGMAVTVGLGLLLVPRTGLGGAAAAFTLGALAQLVVITGFTAWALARPETRMSQLRDGKPDHGGVHVFSE